MSHTGLRHSDDKGFPVNRLVPDDDLYDAAGSHTEYKPLSTKCHPEIPYFNAARLTKTVLEMKNRCEYPVNCIMPGNDGMEWNNFPTCLRTCATIYSGLEGHSRSSPEAANVESFMFHNPYDWKK